MSLRPLRLSALLFGLALAACGEGSRINGVVGTPDQATARFVNATVTSLDLVQGGVVSAGNGNITPGTAVSCFAVPDPVNPDIVVRQTGTTTDLPGFSPRFSAGGRYILIGFPNTSGGIQFATVPTATVSNVGRSAVRVFNASPALATVDVYLTVPGTAFGAPRETGVLFGAASGSFDVAAGTIQVRVVSAGTVVTDLGSFLLAADRSYTIIATSATAPLLVPDC